jgi:hypothetical protein
LCKINKSEKKKVYCITFGYSIPFCFLYFSFWDKVEHQMGEKSTTQLV